MWYTYTYQTCWPRLVSRMTYHVWTVWYMSVTPYEIVWYTFGTCIVRITIAGIFYDFIVLTGKLYSCRIFSWLCIHKIICKGPLTCSGSGLLSSFVTSHFANEKCNRFRWLHFMKYFNNILDTILTDWVITIYNIFQFLFYEVRLYSFDKYKHIIYKHM